MSYKEVLNKGLKRAYEFTIASADFNTKLESKIEEVKKSVKIDGFRPGKVPNNIIMQKHGDAINNEVLNAVINENVSKIIQEGKHRPVSQPKVDYIDKEQEKKDLPSGILIEAKYTPGEEKLRLGEVRFQTFRNIVSAKSSGNKNINNIG